MTIPINVKLADIDIDFQTSFNLNSVIKHAVPASIVKDGKLTKHNSAYYLQSIPIDSHTGFSAIPHKEAAKLGYFKIDFLHLSLLDHIKSKSQLREMIAKEPDWNLLLDDNVVVNLFQLHKHGNLLKRVKPRTVQEVADVLALVRPGKFYLIDRYMKDPVGVRAELYLKPKDGYYFKKAHAISYALTIVANLHMIERGII